MARKTLLTESEIRQFMKLANLGPLGDAKIEEMYGKAHDRDEDELEEGRGSDDDDDLDEGRGDKKDDDLDEGRGGKVMDRDEDELDEMGLRGAMDRDEDEMMGDAEMDMGDAEMDMDAAADDMDADMGGMGDAEREEVMADVVRAVARGAIPRHGVMVPARALVRQQGHRRRRRTGELPPAVQAGEGLHHVSVARVRHLKVYLRHVVRHVVEAGPQH